MIEQHMRLTAECTPVCVGVGVGVRRLSKTLVVGTVLGDSAQMSGLEYLLASFLAGLTVAVLTTPVGVSGAVFLLPVQVTVLDVPSPAVTPTNLLFNVVAIPGALVRYRRRGPLRTPLTSILLAGTVPGVVVGAVVRVFLLPGQYVFRLLVAVLLLALGTWLCLPVRRNNSRGELAPSRRFTVALAAAVGVLGGIYGIGGGSLLSPVLVGRGMPVSVVAPAALLTTFVTSIAGALVYVVLAATSVGGDVAPEWGVGLVAGFGGLLGGYLGAALQPRISERALRVGLGGLAVVTAAVYVIQAAV